MTSTQILQLIVVPMLLCMMLTTGLKTTFAEIHSALAKRPIIPKALMEFTGAGCYYLFALSF